MRERGREKETEREGEGERDIERGERVCGCYLLSIVVIWSVSTSSS